MARILKPLPLNILSKSNYTPIFLWIRTHM